jgi:hypothetical protein
VNTRRLTKQDDFNNGEHMSIVLKKTVFATIAFGSRKTDEPIIRILDSRPDNLTGEKFYCHLINRSSEKE